MKLCRKLVYILVLICAVADCLGDPGSLKDYSEMETVLSRLSGIETSITTLKTRLEQLQVRRNARNEAGGGTSSFNDASCDNHTHWMPLNRLTCYKVLPGWYTWEESKEACSQQFNEEIDVTPPQLIDAVTVDQETRLLEILSLDPLVEKTGIWLGESKQSGMNNSYSSVKDCVEMRNAPPSDKGRQLYISCQRKSTAVCSKSILTSSDRVKSRLRKVHHKITLVENQVARKMPGLLGSVTNATVSAFVEHKLKAIETRLKQQLGDKLMAYGSNQKQSHPGFIEESLSKFERNLTSLMNHAEYRIDASIHKTEKPRHIVLRDFSSDCGGNLMSFSGLIRYTAQNISSSLCRWIIGASEYRSISLKLEEDNFNSSDSKLIVYGVTLVRTAGTIFTSAVPPKADIWDVGTTGRTRVFREPVIVLELHTGNRGVQPPHLHLTFCRGNATLVDVSTTAWNMLAINSTSNDTVQVAETSSNLTTTRTDINGNDIPRIPSNVFNEYFCGGIITNTSGVLTHLSSTLPHFCVWTIRADAFQKISVRLEKENFRLSNSTLRVIPMWGFRYRDPGHKGENSEAILRSQTIWGAGSRGQEREFEGPVVFLQLEVGVSLTPPSFRLSFRGTGSPSTYSNYVFSQHHTSQSSGSISRSIPKGNNQFYSSTVVPAGQVNKPVQITERMISTYLGGDWVYLFQLKKQTVWRMSGTHGLRDLNRDPYTTEGGWILMFFYDSGRESSFQYDYTSVN